jgi:hypothetical protein
MSNIWFIQFVLHTIAAGVKNVHKYLILPLLFPSTTILESLWTW